MSVALDVGLLSGKTVSVEARLDESLAALKRRAQTALAARWLDEEQTLKKAKLESGSFLAFHVGNVQVRGTRDGFSAILGDAYVASWGDWGKGVNAFNWRAIPEQLKGVQQIKPLMVHLRLSSATDRL